MRTTLRHSFLTASLALALGGYTLIAVDVRPELTHLRG